VEHVILQSSCGRLGIACIWIRNVIGSIHGQRLRGRTGYMNACILPVFPAVNQLIEGFLQYAGLTEEVSN